MFISLGCLKDSGSRAHLVEHHTLISWFNSASSRLHLSNFDSLKWQAISHCSAVCSKEVLVGHFFFKARAVKLTSDVEYDRLR